MLTNVVSLSHYEHTMERLSDDLLELILCDTLRDPRHPYFYAHVLPLTCTCIARGCTSKQYQRALRACFFSPFQLTPSDLALTACVPLNHAFFSPYESLRHALSTYDSARAVWRPNTLTTLDEALNARPVSPSDSTAEYLDVLRYVEALAPSLNATIEAMLPFVCLVAHETRLRAHHNGRDSDSAERACDIVAAAAVVDAVRSGETLHMRRLKLRMLRLLQQRFGVVSLYAASGVHETATVHAIVNVLHLHSHLHGPLRRWGCRPWWYILNYTPFFYKGEQCECWSVHRAVRARKVESMCQAEIDAAVTHGVKHRKKHLLNRIHKRQHRSTQLGVVVASETLASCTVFRQRVRRCVFF